MGILKKYSDEACPTVLRHFLLRTGVWLLFVAGCFGTHWLFYDLVTGWVTTIRQLYDRTTDLLQFGWFTLTLLIWVMAAAVFLRDKLNSANS